MEKNINKKGTTESSRDFTHKITSKTWLNQTFEQTCHKKSQHHAIHNLWT